MTTVKLVPGPTVVDILAADLRREVIGQDYAINKFCNALRAMLSGLRDSARPMIVSFWGPSGTGKNHFFDVVAETLGRELGSISKKLRLGEISFDLSELSEDPGRPSLLCVDDSEQMDPGMIEGFVRAADANPSFAHTIIFITSDIGSRELISALEDIVPGLYL